MSFRIKCDNCYIEYEINFNSPENVHTTYVICPKCKKKIHAESDFGFGPVWPAYMYLGNNLFLIVTFFNDNQYEIKDCSRLKKEIIIPQRYVKSNYKYHFKILKYLHKNTKELVDVKSTCFRGATKRKGGYVMFQWLTRLFKPAPDKIEERLLMLFDFLLNDHGYSYEKEDLGNAIDKNGNFIYHGPLNAYRFYNDNLCISILHLVQCDDYRVYLANEKNDDQLRIINGTQLPSHLAYDLPLLALEIKQAVSTHKDYYGYSI